MTDDPMLYQWVQEALDGNQRLEAKVDALSVQLADLQAVVEDVEQAVGQLEASLEEPE